ncbi:MAG: serine/threonine protein kinase [Planctomycetes bacterium]|nr:serine/threonine protein kinase [Planctomycetota bacterium]
MEPRRRGKPTARAAETPWQATQVAAAPPEEGRFENVAGDMLLATLPRMSFEGRRVPVLGNIPLLRLVGRGGMGSVYYGQHPSLGRGVAVKVMPLSLSGMDEAADRFVREGTVAATIKSPHLVELLEIGQEHGLLFLVLEYVEGCSAAEYLSQVLDSGKPGLAERDALDIAIAAAQGLAELHCRGIVHRDVKPSNLFLVRSKTTGEIDFARTKLGDLGVVRSEADTATLTSTNVAIGTPGFMAPEQTVDAKRAGPRADVFSLGATLYTLLRGSPPFEGESQMAVFLATLNKPHLPIRTVRPEVSVASAVLLQKSLAKNPEERQAHAGELLVELRRCRSALAARRVVMPGAEQETEEQRGPIAAWAASLRLWPRLPCFAALAWLGWRQIADPAYAGPLHRLLRAFQQAGPLLWRWTGSTACEAVAALALPFLAVLVLLVWTARRGAWFALFLCAGLLGTLLHHTGQYLKTVWTPAAALGVFQAEESAQHYWHWLLARSGLVARAADLAVAAGEAAAIVTAFAVLGSAFLLWAIFAVNRRA